MNSYGLETLMNEVSPRSSASLSQPRATNRNQKWLVVGVGVIITLLLIGGLAYEVIISRQPTGPSAFAPAGWTGVNPGSVGCKSVAGEVCYSFSIETSFQNLPISNLFFAVSNASQFSYPESNTVSLGQGACVTALNGTAADGVWNMSTGRWSVLPSGMVPIDMTFRFVLDTGLTTNSSLAGTSFWIEHSQPYGGSVGYSLG